MFFFAMRSHVPCGVVLWLASSHVMKALSSGKRRAFCGDGDELATEVVVADEAALDFVAARGFRGIVTLDGCLSD